MNKNSYLYLVLTSFLPLSFFFSPIFHSIFSWDYYHTSTPVLPKIRLNYLKDSLLFARRLINEDVLTS